MAIEGGLPQVPGYEVLEPLAAGGRAEIYLARDKSRDNDIVAIKFLREEDLDRADRVQAFMDEVELSRLLVHPTIVRVYHGEFALGLPYLVMEYVDGVTLWELGARARRAKKKIPFGVAAYFADMVADALAYAHNLKGPDGEPLKLVHRDVSSVNVMVTFDGAVKLLDFGIARSKISSVRTQPGIIKGKLDYLSPEQCSGGTIDALTDVYALGVVLFELCTGQRPFDEEDVGVLFDKICRGNRQKIHQLRPDIPPRLERIIDRAMATKRRRRYKSAAEIHEDLRAFIDKLPSRPTSSSVAELLAELAPEELERVQETYGPSNTVEVEGSSEPRDDEDLTEHDPPHASDDSVDSENPLDFPEAPPQAPPKAPPSTPPAEISDDAATSIRPAAARLSQPNVAKPPNTKLLVVVVAMALVAMCSGMTVVRIARCGTTPATEDIDALAAVTPGIADAAAEPVVVPTPEPDAAPTPPPDESEVLDFTGPDSGLGEQPNEPDSAVLDFTIGADAQPTPEGDGGAALPETSDPTMGFLTVKTRRRAMVFVRGKRIGLTPLERLPLKARRYRIKVRNRYGMRRRWVRIRAGEEEVIEFPL